jgi:protein involved in polysaccharide export with SLBB domain
MLLKFSLHEKSVLFTKIPKLIALYLVLSSFFVLAQNAPLNTQQLPNTSFGIGAGAGGSLAPLDLTRGQNVLRSIDPKTAAPPTFKPVFSPLQPNDFQKFVLQTSGQLLPLFGQNFFENLQEAQNQLLNQGAQFSLPPAYTPTEATPVNSNYLLGAGDELVIRGWGSIEVDIRAVIDRNGMVNIPKVGSVPLAGVKISQADAVIESALKKYYKNFQISVSLGQLRSITVYVVGQARRPGSYPLSSQSTLVSALFATGGPNATGSMRKIELKRGEKIVTTLDLYSFLTLGNTAQDVKLLDGDVIVIPPATGFVAFLGKVNTPSVFELRDKNETLGQLLSVGGGMPVVADPKRVVVERLDPQSNQPRKIIEFPLSHSGLITSLQNGDIVTIDSISPDIVNGVTLRGAVNKPKRSAWFEGMRIKDLIPNRESLVSQSSIRKANETLFDKFERERTLRERNKVPDDLTKGDIDQADLERRINKGESPDSKSPDSKSPDSKSPDSARLNEDIDEFDNLKGQKLSEQIGTIFEDINFEYAVIERIDRKSATLQLLPFNLGAALDDPVSKENLNLLPGDIVSVFSADDVRLPISKRRILVRVEGEVTRPGIYTALPGESLSTLLQRAGGLTQDAYLFGSIFTREEVRQSQKSNLNRLINRVQSESQASLTALAQNAGLDTVTNQARLAAAQEEQKKTIERLRDLKPEGRVSLGLPPSLFNNSSKLPEISLRPGDRLKIPSRPDFVYVLGSVNTETALLFRPGQTVEGYLKSAGVTSGGDRDNVILIRADGSAISSESTFWSSNKTIATVVMPGDTIIMPEKVDKESSWNAAVRNAKDYTQILYQLGLGAAAFKSLRN